MDTIIGNDKAENKSEPQDYWYVLRVRLGSEERVRNALETRLDSKLYLPFVPIKKYPYRMKKEDGSRIFVGKEYICFPGYVFVRSSDIAVDSSGVKIPEEQGKIKNYSFLKNVLPAVEQIKEAHYFIYYGVDKHDIAMRRHERGVLDRLMDKAYQIGASKGFLVGNKITVVEGPLVGLEGLILRMNTHQHTAVIRADMMGDSREITLMLEMVRKMA